MARERFLVVEDDDDGELLLERALLRRFQEATVLIFRDGDEAVAAAKVGPWTGFLIHRALDVDGIEMVRRLRAVAPDVRSVLVSGRDQKTAARDAGAQFVSFTDWQSLTQAFES